jgi:hypothetical protein
VRTALSFCLGTYLVYLGNSQFDENHQLITTSATSAYTLGGSAFDIVPFPPAPLGTRFVNELDQSTLSPMLNAVFEHFDELDLKQLSWSYWHAVSAPVHMAAANFGAAIEQLQRSYMEGHPDARETSIVGDQTAWAAIRSAVRQIVDQTAIAEPAKQLLLRKVDNLNQLPAGTASERFLENIDLTLGQTEQNAWKRRNISAHGGTVSEENLIATIRDTQILRTILNRMVLKLSSASTQYNDYYTIGHPVRSLAEPLP